MTYRKLLLSGMAILALVGLFAFVQPEVASALFDDSKKDACTGIQGTTNAEGECETGGASLSSVIKSVIQILSVVIGLVAVIMIIVGGFKYITANGDSGNLQSAKHTILYAVIGLVIVAFAQFIVQFVLDKTV